MDQMTTRRCTECGKQIPTQALKCPNCASMSMKEQTVKHERKNNLAAVVVILGVCISVLLGVYVRIFAQNATAAIGAIVVGVCFTLYLAMRKK